MNSKVFTSSYFIGLLHGVQRMMISGVNIFVVAICDLVHAVEAMYGLP